ncbi:MAG: hypothetical protein HOK97_01960 [Deltaproteobacteria bacterium]|jgi:hypothetical protein|nr:hypothetical protein [Deltaproteobacteria bacterium]MBT6488501.1 hypothetical protein [Deltaproteobacteria bacterium]
MKMNLLCLALAWMIVGCGEVEESSVIPDETESTDSSNDTSSDDSTDGTSEETIDDTSADNPCAFPLVRLQTGQSETCDGGNEHHWPIGMDESDCHGWQGMDNSGGIHNNSANTIRCNDDGTFEFTQFGGNLNCEGNGTRKVYSLNTCEQDIPPMLYTVAIDLTCCSNPDSPDCRVGIPSAGPVGAEISLNGVVCEP